MYYHINFPTAIHSVVQLPASKSISNRVLIINALSKEPITPENLSDCDDTQVMIHALAQREGEIDILAAGTAMRFLAAYLSVTPGTHVLTGTKRMRERPIKILVDALRTLGATIAYTEKEGYPPLRIIGKELNGNQIQLSGSISSQYISALLMIAPTLPAGLRIELTGEIISRPYIDLTLRLMHEFGIASTQSERTFDIAHGAYRSVPFTVENDWSAASYWYAITALNNDTDILLPGLFVNSYQGDSRVATLFAQLGVATQFTGNGVKLTKSPLADGQIEIDFSDIPDLAQTFVVTCALLNKPFSFTGLQTLKIKETNRIAALINEMRKLGYIINETPEGDGLIWKGERTKAETPPLIDTYDDHRMAMAFAPAAIRVKGLRINHPEVVSKSYPRFWNELEKCGISLQINS
jgi:3-phosphoshikimate 1-carboxyvinyltransferase